MFLFWLSLCSYFDFLWSVIHQLILVLTWSHCHESDNIKFWHVIIIFGGSHDKQWELAHQVAFGHETLYGKIKLTSNIKTMVGIKMIYLLFVFVAILVVNKTTMLPLIYHLQLFETYRHILLLLTAEMILEHISWNCELFYFISYRAISNLFLKVLRH